MASSFFRIDAACGLKVEPAIEFEELRFDLGGGAEVSTLVGHPDGNRRYRVTAQLSDSYGQRVGVTIDPNTQEEIFETQLGGLTRARYVWELFKYSKKYGNAPIVVMCPIEAVDVECVFAESSLSYERIEHAVWGAGIALKQIRGNTDLWIEQMTPTNPHGI